MTDVSFPPPQTLVPTKGPKLCWDGGVLGAWSRSTGMWVRTMVTVGVDMALLMLAVLPTGGAVLRQSHREGNADCRCIRNGGGEA